MTTHHSAITFMQLNGWSMPPTNNWPMVSGSMLQRHDKHADKLTIPNPLKQSRSGHKLLSIYINRNKKTNSLLWMVTRLSPVTINDLLKISLSITMPVVTLSCIIRHVHACCITVTWWGEPGEILRAICMTNQSSSLLSTQSIHWFGVMKHRTSVKYTSFGDLFMQISNTLQ